MGISVHTHVYVCTWRALEKNLLKQPYQRVCSTLYIGLASAVPPTNTNFQLLLLPLKRVCRTQTLTSTERHNSSLHSHL